MAEEEKNGLKFKLYDTLCKLFKSNSSEKAYNYLSLEKQKLTIINELAQDEEGRKVLSECYLAQLDRAYSDIRNYIEQNNKKELKKEKRKNIIITILAAIWALILLVIKIFIILCLPGIMFLGAIIGYKSEKNKW